MVVRGFVLPWRYEEQSGGHDHEEVGFRGRIRILIHGVEI